jgi:hypothetical protein
MEEKWHSIKVIFVMLICISGLVTCSSFPYYTEARKSEAEARKAEAEAEAARARLELQRLINSQEMNGEK